MQEALLLVFIGVGRFFMNSVLYKWAYVSTKLEELLSKHISFPLHTHPYRHICSHLYRSKKVYESKGHRFESCWVHHKPLTCFAPLAVFLFIVSKQFFLILLDLLTLTSRSASSISEDAPRLFSLWSRSILVVLIKMGDLAQIMAQSLFRGWRFSLVLPVFFRAALWHRLGTNRLIPP